MRSMETNRLLIRNFTEEDPLIKLGFCVDGKLRDRRIDLQTGERKSLVVCSITKDEFK